MGWARGGTLAIAADEAALDALVVALVETRVPIRRLDPLISALESMFFALTSDEVTPEMEPIELTERALAAS